MLIESGQQARKTSGRDMGGVDWAFVTGWEVTILGLGRSTSGLNLGRSSGVVPNIILDTSFPPR